MCNPECCDNEQKFVCIHVPRDCLDHLKKPKKNEVLRLFCSKQLHSCKNCIVSTQKNEENDYFSVTNECCGEQSIPVDSYGQSASKQRYLEKCYRNSLRKPKEKTCFKGKKQNPIECCVTQYPDLFLKIRSSNRFKYSFMSEKNKSMPCDCCFEEQTPCKILFENESVGSTVSENPKCHNTEVIYLKPSEQNSCQCMQYKTASEPLDPLEKVLFSMQRGVVEEEKNDLFCKLMSSKSEKCDKSCWTNNPYSNFYIPCNNFMSQEGFCMEPQLSCQCSCPQMQVRNPRNLSETEKKREEKEEGGEKNEKCIKKKIQKNIALPKDLEFKNRLNLEKKVCEKHQNEKSSQDGMLNFIGDCMKKCNFNEYSNYPCCEFSNYTDNQFQNYEGNSSSTCDESVRNIYCSTSNASSTESNISTESDSDTEIEMKRDAFANQKLKGIEKFGSNIEKKSSVNEAPKNESLDKKPVEEKDSIKIFLLKESFRKNNSKKEVLEKSSSKEYLPETSLSKVEKIKIEKDEGRFKTKTKKSEREKADEDAINIKEPDNNDSETKDNDEHSIINFTSSNETNDENELIQKKKKKKMIKSNQKAISFGDNSSERTTYDDSSSIDSSNWEREEIINMTIKKNKIKEFKQKSNQNPIKSVDNTGSNNKDKKTKKKKKKENDPSTQQPITSADNTSSKMITNYKDTSVENKDMRTRKKKKQVKEKSNEQLITFSDNASSERITTDEATSPDENNDIRTSRKKKKNKKKSNQKPVAQADKETDEFDSEKDDQNSCEATEKNDETVSQKSKKQKNEKNQTKQIKPKRVSSILKNVKKSKNRKKKNLTFDDKVKENFITTNLLYEIRLKNYNDCLSTFSNFTDFEYTVANNRYLYRDTKDLNY